MQALFLTKYKCDMRLKQPQIDLQEDTCVGSVSDLIQEGELLVSGKGLGVMHIKLLY